MHILLIGRNSYVGSSMISANNPDIIWTSLSRKDLHSKILPEVGLQPDLIVVVATPSMADSSEFWEFDPKITTYLQQFSSPVICISSVRINDKSNARNRAYIKTLEKFEKIASKHDWSILRLTNFLGSLPIDFPDQQQLIPWSIFPNIISGVALDINSVPTQVTEWIDSNDVVEAVIRIARSGLVGEYVTRPSLNLEMKVLIDLMANRLRSDRGSLTVNYGREDRKIVLTPADGKLKNLGWKSGVNAEAILSKLVDYKRQVLL